MKVFFDTVGCRLNQSEIEKMAARARANGHEVVAKASQADVVVINTCAVTLAASADSRKKIRQAARAGNARIVATGCYATIAPGEISNLPEVSWRVPNNKKDGLIDSILSPVSGYVSGKVDARVALPGKQRRTRAFIKVQDGCDNFCTFCVTRIARGESKSQSRKEIFADIESALAGGVKEIVLSGVNLGAWGLDLKGTPTFSSLVKDIVREISPPRLRLSSLEPWNINEEFYEVLTLPGFCCHLHLPMQSGSAGVLKRMGRRNTTVEYMHLIEKIRQIIPEMAITTDIMVGFPGETQQEFSENLDFVKEIHFSGGHVFKFSLRPGTAAERMEGRVPAEICKQRSQVMHKAFETSRKQYQASFIGRIVHVLWERSKKIEDVWQLDGLSDNYLRVQVIAEKDLRNTISRVKLLEISGDRIIGRVVS